jgi:serine/threonine-protein kinase
MVIRYHGRVRHAAAGVAHRRSWLTPPRRFCVHRPDVFGETVGSYRIEAKLAEGGMGAVYRASHILLGRPAAVKVLLPELSRNHEIVNRFFNEARAATAIRHPGIVEIYDFGYMESGFAYIAMELLDGEPLSRRLATAGRLDEGTALLYTRGIASALAAAHQRGIVHRDLKPDNIFLVPDPDMPTGIRCKLLDFGIAKVAEAARGGEATKTRTGSVMGTPTYMSPEQCRGAGEVDHRSDLYALGCILYEMVTGRPPFNAEGVGEIIGMHLFMAPTPPSHVAPGVSANVEGLVMSLLQKDASQRIQSAAEIVRLLGSGSIPAGPSPASMPPTMMAPAMRTPVPVPTPAPGTSPQVTTLGGAAAESTAISTPPPKRKTGLFVAVGLALVGGGIAAAVAAGGGSKGDTQPAADPTPRAAVTLDAGVVPAVAIDAAVAPAADAAVAEVVPQAIDAGVATTTADTASDRKKKDRDRRRRRDRDKKDTTGTGNTTTTDSGYGIDRGD